MEIVFEIKDAFINLDVFKKCCVPKGFTSSVANKERIIDGECVVLVEDMNKEQEDGELEVPG